MMAVRCDCEMGLAMTQFLVGSLLSHLIVCGKIVTSVSSEVDFVQALVSSRGGLVADVCF